MAPQISIIIPVYNAEKYLSECFDSIIEQTFKNFEVILINDGSTDCSEAICREYAGKDKRFRYIRQENQGVCAARNAGLNAAAGELLAFMDADDWLADNGLELLYKAYQKTGADLIVGNVNFVDGERKRKIRIFDQAFTVSEKQWITQYERACIGYGYNPRPGTRSEPAGLGSLWNKLYKRGIIEDNGIRFDTYVLGIYEDNLFVLEYLEHCGSVSYITDVVYNYRKVLGSNSPGFKPTTLEINRRIFKRINEYIAKSKKESEKDFEKAFYIYVMRRLEVSLSVYFFTGQNRAPFIQKLKELHRLIRREPYKTAIKNVEHRLLKPSARFIWVFARTYSAFMIWLGARAEKCGAAAVKRIKSAGISENRGLQ